MAITTNPSNLFTYRKNRKKLLTLIGISMSLLVTILAISTQDFYVVVSDSMIPNLNTGDIVLIENGNDIRGSSFVNLNLGDIIVFEVSAQSSEFEKGKRTIVHRVEEIVFDSDGQRVIRTKGDANPSSIQGVDYPITEDNYVGKVVYAIPYLGLFLMYLNLLVQIVVQPLFYLAIGAVAGIIFFLEYQNKRGLHVERI
jgi:signal peptidase I